MTDIDKIRADIEVEALRVNAGCKPKFGDLMRNPWASESNPHRDGYFVRSKRVTGRLNPGLWYEMTNREGAFWEINGKCAMFVEAPAVQAVGEPVERTKLWPMQNEEDQEAGIVRQWYFDCDGHYIDVALDDGKYSIFFRDRATGKEGWLDQADEHTPAIQPPPSAEPSPFAYVTADHKMLIFADNVEGVTDDPASLEPLYRGAKQSADPRQVVGIVDERYLRPTNGGEG